MVTVYPNNHSNGVLRYPDPGDRNFDRVISDISVIQRKTTLTISDSVETGSPVEIEIVRVVSLSTTEITETTRFEKPVFRVGLLNAVVNIISDTGIFKAVASETTHVSFCNQCFAQVFLPSHCLLSYFMRL